MPDNSVPTSQVTTNSTSQGSNMKWIMVFVVVVGLLIVAAFSYMYVFSDNQYLNSQNNSVEETMNTDSAGEFIPGENIDSCQPDTKLCPDGTSVGRVPPTCEFDECPLTEF